MAATLLATLGPPRLEGAIASSRRWMRSPAAPRPRRSGSTGKLREVLGAGGFGSVRRAAENPFNLVLEARA